MQDEAYTCHTGFLSFFCFFLLFLTSPLHQCFCILQEDWNGSFLIYKASVIYFRSSPFLGNPLFLDPISIKSRQSLNFGHSVESGAVQEAHPHFIIPVHEHQGICLP